MITINRYWGSTSVQKNTGMEIRSEKEGHSFMDFQYWLRIEYFKLRIVECNLMQISPGCGILGPGLRYHLDPILLTDKNVCSIIWMLTSSANQSVPFFWPVQYQNLFLCVVKFSSFGYLVFLVQRNLGLCQ